MALLLLVEEEGRVVLRKSIGEKNVERKGIRLGSVMEDGGETVIEGEGMEIKGGGQAAIAMIDHVTIEDDDEDEGISMRLRRKK